jgi:serine/threonine protein kinase
MDDRHEDKLLGKFLFKHYKLKKKIGEGSFGKIYIGVHNETKEEYAIKLVSKILNNIKQKYKNN